MSRGRGVGDNYGGYQVGRAIGGRDYDKPETEGSRKPESRLLVGRLIWAIVVMAVIVAGGAILVDVLGRDRVEANGLDMIEPTVEIVNDGGGELSSRVRLLIARLEQEAHDYGLRIERVVIPIDRQRQVNVHILGREEYYRVLIDRSPAESMEDIARVMRFLDREEIQPIYVDVRVPGRAFYY